MPSFNIMKKLKVGLLIDQNMVPHWVYTMIQQILKSDYAEITLIIQNDSIAPKQTFISKLIYTFRFLLFSLYIRLDKILFKFSPNAFELIDINPLLGDIESFGVVPVSTKFSDRFTDPDLQKVKSHDLDVLIRLGFKILRGDILRVAKYGIWSFHHGDNKINRGGPAGVWEVLGGWSETGVILQILTEELDGGIVIESSHSKTDDISIIRNNNNSYWKSLSMIPRNLKKLHSVGGKEFMSLIDNKNKDLYLYYNKLFVTPVNSKLAILIIKKFASKFFEKIHSFFIINQWILLYRFSKSGKLSQSFFRFKKLFPPRDRFWADPFVIFKDSLYYVFIEELMFNTNRGHISVFTLDESGNISKPERILEKNYHLSYPFVFEDNGEYYMIPESEENRTIDLYKSTSFPFKWELVNTLMSDVCAVDTTIHFYNNKYWMFCNIKQNEGASNLDELYIFYADHFNTINWQPHTMNPVISNVKNARPAGKIFQYNNAHYRPAQDCSKHYGRGMHIGKIIILTEEEYAEESIQYLYPLWDKKLRGMHTFNSAENLTIIDGEYRRSRI